MDEIYSVESLLKQLGLDSEDILDDGDTTGTKTLYLKDFEEYAKVFSTLGSLSDFYEEEDEGEFEMGDEQQLSKCSYVFSDGIFTVTISADLDENEYILKIEEHIDD